MPSDPIYPLLTAEEFLEIEFGDRKAELDNGVIRMMAGGTMRHAEVQGNVFSWLRQMLRGSGCRPYGPDMATKTHDLSIRYPDVSVFCNDRRGNEQATWFDDPRVLIEILSAGTARSDLRIKQEEYKQLPSVDSIVFVDIVTERVKVLQRTGTGWNETIHIEPADISLPSLKLSLPHAEIFARD